LVAAQDKVARCTGIEFTCLLAYCLLTLIAAMLICYLLIGAGERVAEDAVQVAGGRVVVAIRRQRFATSCQRTAVIDTPVPRHESVHFSIGSDVFAQHVLVTNGQADVLVCCC